MDGLTAFASMDGLDGLKVGPLDELSASEWFGSWCLCMGLQL